MFAYPDTLTRLAFLTTALALASCGSSGPSTPYQPIAFAPLQAADEERCIASGTVAEGPFIRLRSGLGGPSVCGAARPFEMSAVGRGAIGLRPAALLRCPMIKPVEDWLMAAVDPAAVRYLGAPVREIKVAASYSCRTRNGIAGAKLSEHALANALDISGFVLADGRTVTIRSGWGGTADEQAFLRVVHREACRRFTTVLGPDADRFHHDHLHVDLARHNASGTFRVCR
ncbi:MAG: extensin family protein [Hyphomicrobiaceae bacterium]|nr:extensin family protein [Hyphomicrobiaceae bacterium]